MTVSREATAQELARAFVPLLQPLRDIVKGLWYTEWRGVVTFWVLTTPIDLDTQTRLYEQNGLLYDRFPSVLMDIHVLNPELFKDGNAEARLPSDAVPVPLQQH